ncbi:MAG: ferredoxin [bacterium]|nr:ferredoxin [bacterium]
MDVYVDPDKCIGCEICVNACPDIFEMQADGLSHVKEDAAACEQEGCCEEAAELCPTDAIFINGEPR